MSDDRTGMPGKMVVSNDGYPSGVTGYSVNRARTGGGQMGFDPHNTKKLVNIVHPTDKNQSFQVDLSKINPNENLHYETAGGRAVIRIIDDAGTAEGAREASTEIFRELSQRTNEMVPEVKEATPIYRDQQSLPPVVVQAPPTHQIRSPRAMMLSPTPQPQTVAPVEQVVPEPDKLVVFDMDGPYGAFEAYYHDVIVDDKFIVLIFDRRHRGGGRVYMPNEIKGMLKTEANEEYEGYLPLYLDIADGPYLYQVASFGFNWMEGYLEHCLLPVDNRREKTGLGG